MNLPNTQHKPAKHWTQNYKILNTNLPDIEHEPTRVDADAELQLFVGFVTYFEGSDGTQQIQRHRADFPGVARPVGHRKSRHHHVGVSYSLHLAKKKLFTDVGIHYPQ